MTPTPRTDAECYDCEYRGDMGSRFTADRGKHDPYGEHVAVNFARQLERERNELLEALEACMKIIGTPHALESECWATTDEINAAWDKGTAAIAKTKRKL